MNCIKQRLVLSFFKGDKFCPLNDCEEAVRATAHT